MHWSLTQSTSAQPGHHARPIPPLIPIQTELGPADPLFLLGNHKEIFSIAASPSLSDNYMADVGFLHQLPKHTSTKQSKETCLTHRHSCYNEGRVRKELRYPPLLGGSLDRIILPFKRCFILSLAHLLYRVRHFQSPVPGRK